MEDTKSLKLTISTKAALDKLKIHPRQTYEETIKNLIQKTKGDRVDTVESTDNEAHSHSHDK